MNDKEKYMARALELAKKGAGHTKQNPMVGCVVVKEGRIVAEGYHEKYGEFHAERNALTRCTEDVTGAEMYVTLEPCCHHGKTPPCTDIIMERGIKKVYVGSMDPNPLVGGKGVSILRDAGIEVETGVLESECMHLNEIFFHYISTKRPFVAMKYAMTLDGRIASCTGDSKWVTGEEARHHVHELRRLYSSILVGIGTVLADDPMLNCRIEDGVDPIRLICDSSLGIPEDSAIVKTAEDIKTIVFAAGKSKNESILANKKQRLERKNVEVVIQEGVSRVDLKTVFDFLAEREINSVLVEGGATIHGTLLSERIFDKVYAYVAPKLIGGKGSLGPVGGGGIELMRDAAGLENVRMTRLGWDFLIEGMTGKSKRPREV